GTFAARDPLRCLVQIADRAFAADRAVIAMRRLNAEPRRELLLRVAIAPAQEIDHIERADLAEQLGAGIGFRALQRLLEQIKRLEALLDLLRSVDDLADADDDGNAVFQSGTGHEALRCFLFFRTLTCIRRHCEERSDEAIQSLMRGSGLLRFARNDAAHVNA